MQRPRMRVWWCQAAVFAGMDWGLPLMAVLVETAAAACVRLFTVCGQRWQVICRDSAGCIMVVKLAS
jgi:hypothetical protein